MTSYINVIIITVVSTDRELIKHILRSDVSSVCWRHLKWKKL